MTSEGKGFKGQHGKKDFRKNNSGQTRRPDKSQTRRPDKGPRKIDERKSQNLNTNAFDALKDYKFDN